MKSVILVLVFVTAALALKCNYYWDDNSAVSTQTCNTLLSPYCITFSGKYNEGNGKDGKATIQACESDAKIQGIEILANLHCAGTGRQPINYDGPNGMLLDGHIDCCNTDNCNNLGVVNSLSVTSLIIMALVCIFKAFC